MTTAAVQALCAACRCHMMKQTCRKDSRIGGCSLSSGEYILCLFTLACIKLPLNTSGKVCPYEIIKPPKTINLNMQRIAVSSPKTRRFLVFVCEGSRILRTVTLYGVKLHESNRNTIRLPHTCSETSHSTGTGNCAYFDITAPLLDRGCTIPWYTS